MFMQQKKIPVGISARHIHLSAPDLLKLFGEGASLKLLRPLTQPGQFAAEQTLKLQSEHGIINDVRIIGPLRAQTQVELSLTDARTLGINPPLCCSGNYQPSEPIKLIGPYGEIQLAVGIMISQRHLHLSPNQAAELNLVNGQAIAVRADGERSLVFHQVVVRVADNFTAELHLDTDEANAAGLKNGDLVTILD